MWISNFLENQIFSNLLKRTLKNTNFYCRYKYLFNHTLHISDFKNNLNIALFVVFEQKLIFYDLNVQTWLYAHNIFFKLTTRISFFYFLWWINEIYLSIKGFFFLFVTMILFSGIKRLLLTKQMNYCTYRAETMYSLLNLKIVVNSYSCCNFSILYLNNKLNFCRGT